MKLALLIEVGNLTIDDDPIMVHDEVEMVLKELEQSCGWSFAITPYNRISHRTRLQKEE